MTSHLQGSWVGQIVTVRKCGFLHLNKKHTGVAESDLYTRRKVDISEVLRRSPKETFASFF